MKYHELMNVCLISREMIISSSSVHEVAISGHFSAVTPSGLKSFSCNSLLYKVENSLALKSRIVSGTVETVHAGLLG